MERETSEGLEAGRNYVDQMKEIDETEDTLDPSLQEMANRRLDAEQGAYADAARFGTGVLSGGRHVPLIREPTPEEIAKCEAEARRYERKELLLLAAQLGFHGDDAINAARRFQDFMDESNAVAGHPSPPDTAQQRVWDRQRALDQAIGSFGHEGAVNVNDVMSRTRVFYDYVNGGA